MCATRWAPSRLTPLGWKRSWRLAATATTGSPTARLDDRADDGAPCPPSVFHRGQPHGRAGPRRRTLARASLCARAARRALRGWLHRPAWRRKPPGRARRGGRLRGSGRCRRRRDDQRSREWTDGRARAEGRGGRNGGATRPRSPAVRTAQDFARSAGAPLGAAAAADCLAIPRLSRSTWDVSTSPRAWYATSPITRESASTPMVAARAQSWGHLLHGALPYVVGFFAVLRGYRNQRFELRVDDTPVEPPRRVNMVILANGTSYAGMLRIAPRASLVDGLLDVIVVGDVGRLEFLLYLPLAVFGRHLGHPKVSSLRARRVAIGAATPCASPERWGARPASSPPNSMLYQGAAAPWCIINCCRLWHWETGMPHYGRIHRRGPRGRRRRGSRPRRGGALRTPLRQAAYRLELRGGCSAANLRHDTPVGGSGARRPGGPLPPRAGADREPIELYTSTFLPLQGTAVRVLDRPPGSGRMPATFRSCSSPSKPFTRTRRARKAGAAARPAKVAWPSAASSACWSATCRAACSASTTSPARRDAVEAGKLYFVEPNIRVEQTLGVPPDELRKLDRAARGDARA